MDKEDIKRAAQEAVNDLQLDCRITEVTRPIGKDTWCIQFTGSYGQFCDAFHDEAGKDNSARVIREKIKRYFLKQRKPTRIVRGRASSARSSRQADLVGTLIEAGEQALKGAARITGEVVERATTLNQAVRETGAVWVEGMSPTAAEIIRPEGGSTRTGVGPPPQRIVEAVSHQAKKPTSQTTKSTRKATGKTAADATKTTRARAAKASKSRTSKKAAAKKTAKKRATKKVSKKSSKKKKGRKTRRQIKYFY